MSHVWLCLGFLALISNLVAGDEEGNSLASAFGNLKDFVKDFNIDNLKSDTKEGLTENAGKLGDFLKKIKEKSTEIAERNPLLKTIVEKVTGWSGQVEDLKTAVENQTDEGVIKEKSTEWTNLLKDMEGNGLGKLVTFVKTVTSSSPTIHCHSFCILLTLAALFKSIF